MPYIGNQPAEQFTSFATPTFSVSATTSYTLDHAVTNENEIALFVNNVRQQPGSGKAYTATGTALTLSAATASTDTMYCMFLGRALQTVNPATNSITAAMISANAITGAKLNTDVISAQTELASAPASTDELLISDAGVLKRIDFSLIGGKNTPAFSAYAASQTISDQTSTKLVFGTELYDTDSAYNASTGRFTVPSGAAGKYFFSTKYRIENDTGYLQVEFYKNGSEYIGGASREENGYGSQRYISVATSFSDDLSAGDYIEAYAYMSVGNTNGLVHLTFTGFKLIE